MNKNDVLNTALDVLDHDGWCQGELAHPDGRVCLTGALHKASTIFSGDIHMDKKLCTVSYYSWSGEISRAYDDACAAVENILGLPDPPNGAIPKFNDDPLTTVEDVKLVLKRAMED